MMIASVFIGLGIFFFLFVPLGIYMDLFIIYGIGLTGAGLSFALFSLFVKRSWKGFKRVQDIPTLSSVIILFYRLFIFAIGVFALYGATAFWLDLPDFFNKEYAKLEGIPSQLTYEEPARGDLTGTMIITINGKTLPLHPTPQVPIENLQGRYFQIHYLPNTEWIIHYEIDGKKTDKN